MSDTNTHLHGAAVEITVMPRPGVRGPRGLELPQKGR
jgi:hypothetical protein